MNSAGPRSVEFVVGGSNDASAADLLTTRWDDVAFDGATSFAAPAFEDGWEVVEGPTGDSRLASVGFVTGTQGVSTVGAAAGEVASP